MKDDREQSKGEMPGGDSSSEGAQSGHQQPGVRDEAEDLKDEGSRGWVVPPDEGDAGNEDNRGIPPPGGEDEGSRGW